MGYLGAVASQPVFLDANGRVATQFVCGQTITYAVPGYSKIWLVQTQNGQPQFNGPMAVPMPPYTLDCTRDVGTFVQTAYELTTDGKRGGLIGGATANVLPSLSLAPVVAGGGPVSVSVTAAAPGAPFDPLTSSPAAPAADNTFLYVALAAGAYLLLGGKRK